MARSKAVLVTGGAGYIGSHAVLELLAAGYEPVVVDDLSAGVRAAVPDGVPFVEGSVLDQTLIADTLATYEIGAIMHFAGSIIVPESVVDPLKYYRNNTLATLLLAEAAVSAGVESFIFSSTATVYGMPDASPIPEDAPTSPISPYGQSKLMSEQILLHTAAAHSAFHPIVLRYFNVAGADPGGRAGQQGPNVTHLVRLAVETALGLRPQLELFGQDYPTRDGTCERDYVHVSDLAAAHVSALRYLEAGGAPQVFNCGTGRGHTVKEVVACVEQVTGSPLRVVLAPRRAGDAASLVAKAERIGRALDWRPANAGLADIVSTALAWHGKLAAGAKEDQRPVEA